MLAQEPHPSGDRGWIINTASVIGLVGQATASEYSASKGGVVNLVSGPFPGHQSSRRIELGASTLHVNIILTST